MEDEHFETFFESFRALIGRCLHSNQSRKTYWYTDLIYPTPSSWQPASWRISWRFHGFLTTHWQWTVEKKHETRLGAACDLFIVDAVWLLYKFFFVLHIYKSHYYLSGMLTLVPLFTHPTRHRVYLQLLKQVGGCSSWGDRQLVADLR